MSPTDYNSRNKRVRFIIRSTLIIGYATLVYILYLIVSTATTINQFDEGETKALLAQFMLLFFALFVIGIVLVMVFTYHDKNFKNNIVKPTVENVIPGLTYFRHAPQLSEKDLKERQIISGLNLDLGSYQHEGQKLIYSDSNLSYTAHYIIVQRSRAEKNAKLKQPNLVAFQGWIVVATPQKEIGGTVIIVPAANLSARETTPDLPRIRLEHTKLSEYYNVFSNDEILARIVLTPTEIMALIKTHDNYPRLRFSYHKNFLTVGLPEEADPFKVSIWQAVNYDNERARIETVTKKLHSDIVAILAELTN